MQIEEAQLELQRAQNEMLQQLLHNIDVSLSSEAQTIKELQETVEELHKQYSQTQDTCSPVEEGTDNSKSTEDTDKLTTLAAHFDVKEYTEDELNEIRQFAEFVKNKRK